MQRRARFPTSLRGLSQTLLAVGVIEAMALFVLGELAVDDAVGGIGAVLFGIIWTLGPVPAGWSLVRDARTRSNVVIGLSMQALALVWTPLCVVLYLTAEPDALNALIFIFVPIYLGIAASVVGALVAGALQVRRHLRPTS